MLVKPEFGVQEQRAEALSLKREMEIRYAEARKAHDRHDRSLAQQLMQRVRSSSVFQPCSCLCVWQSCSRKIETMLCVFVQAHQCHDRYKAAQAAASEVIFKKKCAFFSYCLANIMFHLNVRSKQGKPDHAVCTSQRVTDAHVLWV